MLYYNQKERERETKNTMHFDKLTNQIYNALAGQSRDAAKQKGEFEKMKVTYLKKGVPFDYKRIDHEKTVYLYRPWRSGGLLYGYKNQFSVVAIAVEDIISIDEDK